MHALVQPPWRNGETFSAETSAVLERVGTVLGEREGTARTTTPCWARSAAQGVAQQRALLCRQAAARFDADTADRLANLLAPIADPERLAEVGDWLVRCDTATSFLARFDPASPS